MGKSFLTMSAEKRMKMQARQSRKLDSMINKKFRKMKKVWKRKAAGMLIKGITFVALAVVTGAVAAEARNVLREKLEEVLRRTEQG